MPIKAAAVLSYVGILLFLLNAGISAQDVIPTVVTEEASPAATDVQTVTPETITPSPEENSASPTSVTVTDVVTLTTPTEDITATQESSGLIEIQARALYQAQREDHSGIQLFVYNEQLTLLSVAQTDASGTYTIAVPSSAFYWFVAEAPAHRRFVVGIQPGSAPSDIILAGGDVNSDGCVNNDDLQILVERFDQSGEAITDLNSDQMTDAHDLAILTGNFDPRCESPTPTPTPTILPSATWEATSEWTDVPVETSLPNAEPEASQTPTLIGTEATPTEFPTLASTELPSETPAIVIASPTVEPTLEVTPSPTELPTETPTIATATTTAEPSATGVPSPTLTATAVPSPTPEPVEATVESG
jgi:hypothetical protein